MLRISTFLAAFLLFCSPLFAQRPDGWQDSFDKGLAALTSGKHDEGIAAFKVCLDLDGADPTCAYNIACGYSLKNELDSGIEWLGKAIDWGFAREQANIDTVETGDADLANLRKDERFPGLLEKMRKSIADRAVAVEAEWKNPIIVLPDGHEEMKDLGAIIVLHEAGSSKKDVSESYWKAVANELHLVLIAPSGLIPTGDVPAQGMAWFSSFETFMARYWDAEKSLEPAVAALKKMNGVDANRVFIAGQGQGGIVAFNAAMRGPRLYRGVITVESPLLVQLTESYLPNAVSAELKVRALVNTQSMYGASDDQIAGFTDQFRTALTQSKLNHEVKSFTPSTDKPNLVQDLVTETLRAMLAPDK